MSLELVVVLFFFFFFLPRKALTNEAFYDAYKTALVARFFILSTFPLQRCQSVVSR